MTFADDATADLFHGRRTARVRRFPATIIARALRKLDQLANAAKLDDLRVPPSNHLEALSGDLAGYFSIRVNDQWRIVFAWQGNEALQVRLVDYH